MMNSFQNRTYCYLKWSFDGEEASDGKSVVVVLGLCRPLDILARILEEHQPERVRHFFEMFGAPEAAAMCVAIASSRPGVYTAVSALSQLAVCCCHSFSYHIHTHTVQ